MSNQLKVHPCTMDAAKYAVTKWHYSRTMPAGKRFCVGAWENDIFVGAVVFGSGANRNIGSEYSLTQDLCIELVRVALNTHSSPVSKIVTLAIKQLKAHSPNLRLLVSYADPAHGHYGGIYQAMNWTYVGLTKSSTYVKMPNGKLVHGKTIYSKYGRSNPSRIGGEYVQQVPKHKYLYPLDRVMRKQIDNLKKPYPSKQQPHAGS